MNRSGFLRLTGFLGLALLVGALPWGNNLAYGNTGPAGVTLLCQQPVRWQFGNRSAEISDGLPGLGLANANTRGQYIPIAVPDTTTFPGCDYYHIGIVQFSEQFHADLPKASQVRGYVDLGTGAHRCPIMPAP